MLVRTLVPLALVVITAVAAVACRGESGPGFQAPAAPAGAPAVAPPEFARFGYEIEPRMYDVPAGRATEVRRLLHNMSYPTSVVTKDGAQTQYVPLQATFTSDRHLVVTAPVQYHPAIKAILDKLAATPGAPASYEITYWIVRAEAAAKTAVAAELAELTPVFDGLTAIGPRSYTLIDHLSARTSDGDDATLSGQIASVNQRLTSMPDAVDLEIHLTVRAPGAAPAATLETTLQLVPGAPVVLGDSAATRTNLDAPAALLLYIIRVR